MFMALAIIFAGLAGDQDHAKVERQVTALVRSLHVAAKPVPAAVLHVLVHHDDTTRDAVRQLHAGGVIACEVTIHNQLRVVIYDRDGKLVSYSDSPLSHDVLAADDLDILRENLASDVAAMTGEPTLAGEPAAPAPPPAPRTLAPPPAPAEPASESSADEQADTSETITAADIEAMTSTNVSASAAPTGPDLHIGATVGFGVASRSFSAGPSTVAGYNSSPVGALHLDVDIAPSTNNVLRLSTERTLGMTTQVDAGSVGTQISRWEASAGHEFVGGHVVPQLGFGRRSFAIDSDDPTRSPDNAYDYLIVGAAGGTRLGSHVGVSGNAAFEPVVAGAESTEMTLGEATRWAIDVGGAIDVRFGHARARAAVDYQRFTWAWNMAGARGAGGAVDSYLSGSLSIGAEY